MKIQTYSEEIFQRSILWYIMFGVITVGLTIFSGIKGNIYGAIILILNISAYLYFQLKKKTLITIKISNKGMLIGKKKVSWLNITGYVLERDKKKKIIKNIVLLYQNSKHEIFTIQDSPENIEKFSKEMDTYRPLQTVYKQTFLEKFYRRIKL